MGLGKRRRAKSAPPIVRIPSRHKRDRKLDVGLLVVHAMGEWVVDDDGQSHHATDYLDSQGYSVHSLILPDGRIVECLDPEHHVAFHAKGVNNTTAGAEFLVAGTHTYPSLLERMAAATDPPYTEAQYRAGGRLYAGWAKRFDLPWSALQGHEQIDPERKRDPGRAFDWDRLQYWFERAA